MTAELAANLRLPWVEVRAQPPCYTCCPLSSLSLPRRPRGAPFPPLLPAAPVLAPPTSPSPPRPVSRPSYRLVHAQPPTIVLEVAAAAEDANVARKGAAAASRAWSPLSKGAQMWRRRGREERPRAARDREEGEGAPGGSGVDHREP